MHNLGLANSICNGSSKDRHRALEELYKLSFKTIKNYIVKNSGNQEDAKDVFQDGMTILYHDIVTKKFREESSLTTYLFSICKNLWLQNLRQKRLISLVSLDQAEMPQNNFVQNDVDINLLTNLLKTLNEDCKNLLTDYYYHHKPMKELMITFKLGSEQVARTKKMRCMTRLTTLIKEKGLFLNSFLI